MQSSESAARDALISEYRQATAEQAYHQGLIVSYATTRQLAAARLADEHGMSYADITTALGLGSRSLAQKLVERGRAEAASPGRTASILAQRSEVLDHI